jgi:hypothetical protein
MAVKHLPQVPVEVMKETRLFDELHLYDRSIPLAHNYICYSHETGKKGNQTQIEECLHKLPKALIDFATRVVEGRHIFLPVALFSGQIFSVSYDGSLIVKERPFLQYYLRFDKPGYVRKLDDYLALGTTGNWLANLDKPRSHWRSKEIKNIAGKLGGHYQIDFVSESGLNDYIAMVEKQVVAIPTDGWKLPAAPVAEEPAKS